MKAILTLVLLFISLFTKAQIVGELFTSKKYTSQEVWWSKPFSDSSKFSLFTYNRLRIDHLIQLNNEFLNYSTVNYELGKGFGISAGQLITNQSFSPIVALNYFYANETWLVNLFPSIETKRNANADFFTFIQFKPRISKKLRLFTQFIGNVTFNTQQHKFSEQALRVGLSAKTFQFGLGLDARQITIEQNGLNQRILTQSFGIFVRTEL